MRLRMLPLVQERREGTALKALSRTWSSAACSARARNEGRGSASFNVGAVRGRRSEVQGSSSMKVLFVAE